jgi:hypothetical protein
MEVKSHGVHTHILYICMHMYACVCVCVKSIHTFTCAEVTLGDPQRSVHLIRIYIYALLICFFSATSTGFHVFDTQAYMHYLFRFFPAIFAIFLHTCTQTYIHAPGAQGSIFPTHMHICVTYFFVFQPKTWSSAMLSSMIMIAAIGCFFISVWGKYYIYTYICLCVYNICICIYTYMYVCIDVCMYVYIYIYIYIYICMYLYII